MKGARRRVVTNEDSCIVLYVPAREPNGKHSGSLYLVGYTHTFSRLPTSMSIANVRHSSSSSNILQLRAEDKWRIGHHVNCGTLYSIVHLSDNGIVPESGNKAVFTLWLWRNWQEQQTSYREKTSSATEGWIECRSVDRKFFAAPEADVLCLCGRSLRSV